MGTQLEDLEAPLAEQQAQAEEEQGERQRRPLDQPGDQRSDDKDSSDQGESQDKVRHETHLPRYYIIRDMNLPDAWVSPHPAAGDNSGFLPGNAASRLVGGEVRGALIATSPLTPARPATIYNSGSQRRSGFDCGLALMPQDSGREKYAGAVPHYRSPPLYTPQLQ